MPDNSRFSRTEETTLRAQGLRAEVTKTESCLWPRLCKSRMGAPFRRQHPIGPYFADYCCVPLKLVIEIDGPTHERNNDEARDRFLAERGYDVLHFSVEDMDKRFKNVVETIHQHVQIRLLEKSITEKKKQRGETSL
jgi:very-short-patch-repair endonuclease